MLKPTEETLGQEVPSMMLGPPSPSWTQLGVGSPTGLDKAFNFPLSPSEEDAPVSLEISAAEEINAQPRASKRRRTAPGRKGAKESAAQPVKRARLSYLWEPEQQLPIGLSQSSILIANTGLSADEEICTVLPTSSEQEMAHVDTEEFITEFWGDLLSDLPPMTDDGVLVAAEPADAAPLNALVTADGDLMGDVTDAQLLELSELLEPAVTEQEQEEPLLLAQVSPDSVERTEQETSAQAALELLQQAEVAESTDADDLQVEAPAQQISAAQKYRRIRDNNNQASRRSRLQRKQRERDQEQQAELLSRENARLRARVETLQGLLDKVKALAPLLTARH